MADYPCWAIADNGPAAGSVFEVDARLIAVTLVCDDGTHRYLRQGFGTKKGWRIAHFQHVDSLVV